MTALEVSSCECAATRIEQMGEIFEIDFQSILMQADTVSLGEMSSVPCVATAILMC